MFIRHGRSLFRDENAFRQHPNCHGSLGMRIQLTVLPLDREEVIWLQKIDHQLQITRIPVSGYSQALGNEFHHTTSLVDHVFNTRHDGFFGDRWSRYDIDQVPVFDFHIAVATNGHLTKSINRLTHTTRLENNQLMVFKSRHFFWFNQETFIS